MKIPQFIFIIFITIFFSCQFKANEVNDEGILQASFVSNPQPVKEQEVTTLSPGADAPDFNLPGVDGNFYSLENFKNSEVLVIIFSCNHCPTAQAYERRIMKVAEDYKHRSVSVVMISPNSPLGLLYEELGYTDLNDDYLDMQIRAEYMQYDFPYLYDGDTQSTSLKYGPVATPHAFVFDQDRKLQYTGRLDKVEKPGSANAEDLRSAIDAVLAGETVGLPVTKTFGCSTKWGWKIKMKERANRQWVEKPINLEKINTTGIRELLKNEDSGKLRLVNVWATWCGPCRIEYPEFIVIQRMYGARDFEFVSISADKPEIEDKVLSFLEEYHSAVPNFLYAQDDKYTLIEAVNPKWDGALPYTVLVEPGGKIVWHHQGEVDFLELKRTIVEHPMMGRYY